MVLCWGAASLQAVLRLPLARLDWPSAATLGVRSLCSVLPGVGLSAHVHCWASRGGNHRSLWQVSLSLCCCAVLLCAALAACLHSGGAVLLNRSRFVN